MSLLHDLKRAVVLAPDDPGARLALAEALYGEGELDAAEKQLDALLAARPDHVAARLLLARVYVRQKRLPSAERALLEAAKQHPDDDDVRIALVELFTGIGRLDDALVHLLSAIRIAPTSARHLAAAELSRQRRLFPRAKAHLAEARAGAPGDARVIELAREVALELGELEGQLASPLSRGAAFLLARARAEVPVALAGQLGPATSQALAALAGGDVALAKRPLALASADEQASAPYLLVRAAIFSAQGAFDRVEETLRRATVLAPGAPLAWARLAELLAHRGAHADAARTWEKALSLAPDDPGALEGLGDALLLLGDRPAAALAYERAARRSPAGTAPEKLAALRLRESVLPPGPVAGKIGALGWNAYGGTVSPIEAVAVPGKGELVFTGNVGRTGQDAAKVAFSCLRARGEALGIERALATHDLHLHYVDTELAKDGPSAGLALALAGYAAYAGKPLREALAATGEITLQGAVRPVGGLHEKLVASYLAGVHRVLVPRKNLHEVARVPDEVRAALTIVRVDTLGEALEHALA